jgi:RNA polymerase sigma-70 factor, ECF subfamily
MAGTTVAVRGTMAEEPALGVGSGGAASSLDDAIEALLVSRTPEAVRLAAFILRDPIAAEDIVQDAALSAWHRRNGLRSIDSAEGWFMRIVVNACRDELRRRSRVRSLPAIEPFAGPTSDRLAEADELAHAVGRLPPDQQIVLGLRYGRDMTVPRIAAVTGLPEGTVKSRLHHSLNSLKGALAVERGTR